MKKKTVPMERVIPEKIECKEKIKLKKPKKKWVNLENDDDGGDGKYPRYKNKIHYIEDPKVFNAVSFVRSLIKEDMPIQLAIWKAAKYYKVSQYAVAKEIGIHANNCKYGRTDE